MFNDLSNGNQTNPPKALDDIFAETDKSPESKKSNPYGVDSEIETKQSGILASPDTEPLSSKSKIIKISLLVLLVILVIALVYLAYSKFFSNNPVAENISNQNPIVEEDNSNNTIKEPVIPVVTPNIVSSTPTTTPEVLNTVPATTTTPALVDSDADGLSDQEEKVLTTNPNLIDTDTDGLSDYEEIKINSTNPLLIDTDGDTLSDYEEIKIYKTNPNNIDTDGDTYSDSSEVKSGYNPVGAGKLNE